MLELRDLHVVFAAGTATERHALRGLNLSVRAGETVTVIGPNGCGKSTLLKAVAGAVHAERGAVLIDGVDVTALPEHRRSRLVGRVHDDPRLGTAPALDIGDNLAFALHRGRRRVLHPAGSRGRRSAGAAAVSALGLGLERRLAAPVEQLSAGQRQSLSMVMAAVTEPAVLLLDEHLSALDPRTADTVRALTVELVARLGCATLMVTHNMRDAIDIGERLIVLKEGRVAARFEGARKRALHPLELSELIGAP